jgi:hypothetical protein
VASPGFRHGEHHHRQTELLWRSTGRPSPVSDIPDPHPLPDAALAPRCRPGLMATVGMKLPARIQYQAGDPAQSANSHPDPLVGAGERSQVPSGATATVLDGPAGTGDWWSGGRRCPRPHSRTDVLPGREPCAVGRDTIRPACWWMIPA